MTRRGFTLIEIVIAVAITAFIGLIIATSFSTTINSKDLLDVEGDRDRSIDAALGRMVREIGAAYVSDRYDTRRFRDQYDRPTNFIGSRDRLQLTSLAHQRLYADAKESDQEVLEYFLKSSPDRNASNRLDLVRREKVILDDRNDRGGSEDTLFEGARALRFAYWDSAQQRWDDAWDTRRSERKAILPTRVKITLVIARPDGSDLPYTTQVRIMLNTEFPRFQ